MTTSAIATTKASARPRGGLRYIPVLALATDLTLISVVVIAAILGRETLPFPIEAKIGNALDIAGPAMVIGWMTAIFTFGGYRPQVFGAGLDEYRSLIRASLLTAAAVGIGCYLLQLPLSRGFFVLAFLIGIPALVLGRFLLRSSIHRARSKGALQATSCAGSVLALNAAATPTTGTSGTSASSTGEAVGVAPALSSGAGREQQDDADRRDPCPAQRGGGGDEPGGRLGHPAGDQQALEARAARRHRRARARRRAPSPATPRRWPRRARPPGDARSDRRRRPPPTPVGWAPGSHRRRRSVRGDRSSQHSLQIGARP